MSHPHHSRGTRVLAATMLGVLVLLAFFWWSGPHMGQHDGACIPASLMASDCPNVATSSALSFHAGALRQFSEVTITSQSDLLIALLALGVFGLLGLARQSPLPSSLAVVRPSIHEYWRVPEQQRFNDWLALHESSPSPFV